MSADAAFNDQIAVPSDCQRALGQLFEMRRVIRSSHAIVSASVKAEGGAAIGGAESIRDPARVDAKVGRCDVVQRQRVLERRRARRSYLRRWR